ncbi:MAG TPA: long-chain fatty acid--CoA ligase [Thermodesulfobacteriota bacterium]|nr:long-chain fatty acid--CoA ligase [Thermodesulfobacteriota bacterium]
MNRPWLKQYERRVPHSITYPEIPVQRFLLDTAAKHPGDIAISFNEMQIPYKELNARVNMFAHALLKTGVEKGDRVALLLVNSPVYVIAFFAIVKIGAIVVNLSVGIQGEELIHCLNESGAKIVVTMDLFAQNIYKVINNTKVKTVILHSVMGLEKKMRFEEGTPQPRLFQEVLAASPNVEEPAVQVSPGDAAVLQYTSGSTGTPKAATLTHSNLVASVLQSETWMGMSAGNAAVMCVIPFFHVFGMSACLLLSVRKGYRMVILPRIDLMDMLSLMKIIETYRPISFPAVPSLWGAILSLPPEKARDQISSIQVATSGGAPLPPWAHEKFETLTGRKMMEAYGLSEASSATHFTPYPLGGPRGSIGVPLPDTEAKIMDIETGEKECPVGEIGELVVKGPQIMRGYWNNEELTSTVLRHGWFYTGDLARMDEDGFFYIVDRKDDLILSSGFNVYPSQVEEILEKHPKIKEAAVIGVPDRVKGQAILAVIVLREGMQGDKEEFLSYCKEKMPDYRVPKSILLRDAIPRNPAGKILKRVLRREAQAV